MPSFVIHQCRPEDESRLGRVAPGVFDGSLDPSRLRVYLDAPGHLLLVAIVEDVVVGMLTAVRYLNPDKPSELWIIELAVAAPYRNHGIATALIRRAIELARETGCQQAWVLTDEANGAANHVYSRAARSFRSHSQLLYELSLADD